MEQYSKEQVVHVHGENTLGITALVLGIVALVGSWIPGVNFLSIVIAAAGGIVGLCAFVAFLRRKSSSCVLSVLGTALNVLALYVAFSINNQFLGGGSSSKVVSSSENTASTSNSKKNENTTDTEDDKEYKVGDVISFDDKSIKVTKVKRNFDTGNRFSKPKAGKEFIKVSLGLQNKSSSNVSLNSHDFQVQDSNGLLVSPDSSTYSLNDQFDSSNALAPGGCVSGSIVFEVAKNDNNLKLVYSPSFWSSKKITIKL